MIRTLHFILVLVHSSGLSLLLLLLACHILLLTFWQLQISYFVFRFNCKKDYKKETKENYVAKKVRKQHHVTAALLFFSHIYLTREIA